MAGRRAERFLTTVLFTDIVGSTELAAELGDRGWRDLVQEHHRLVRAALRRHGGREIDTAGDSFFAVFDAPAAGVECALEIGPAVEPLGLQVRAGLHVGEVEQIAGKVGGITVPIASRIMSAAGAGEVLVSQTVRDLSAGSGLHFEDRGTRELKGVPGEWHLFAVTRAAQAAAEADLSDEDRTTRRAAAVRRAQSRPVWRRNPRATAAVVAAVVVVLVAAGLYIWQPWLPPALPGVAENSVGVIDPGRSAIVAQAAVGAQPGAIAVGEGSVWVANVGDDTVSQLDPKTHAVIDTIDVGKSPAGIAVGAGSVWVADSGERAVTRINAATRRVVDTITVGNGPRSVAFGANAVWVANAGDGTITRIDAATGKPGAPISVTTLPSAIAADDAAVWVTSADGGTVSQLDPRSGLALAPPIAVGTRPAAVALGDGAAWVGNAADGTVSKIDPSTHRVSAVIDVGGTPVALALAGSILWVADVTGVVERVDTTNLSGTATRIPTGSAPQAIAWDGGQLWFASRASLSSHRGGTLRIASQGPPDIDPNRLGFPLGVFIGDGLVGYRRVGGIAGTQLLPDLATTIPQPTDGGLTYTFQLRPGLVYSNGSPVRPADFRYALERTFQVADPTAGSLGSGPYQDLVGADACKDPPVRRCDLSKGVVTDDSAGTVTFHLSAPETDFLFALTFATADPVPEGSVPANDLISGPFPVTGPYEIATVADQQLTLRRNPHFRSWDPQVRPDGYPDEIVVNSGIDPADQVSMVESGKADYMAEQIPADAFSALRTQYTPQLHVALGSTTFFFLNTTIAPFDKPAVRKALSFAVDRAHVVDLRGGEIAAAVTCQVLPPNFPGYEPYCPYTADPGPGGRWTAPDLTTARQLVAASGTTGMKITVGPTPPRLTPLAEYVAGILRDLGYDVTVRTAQTGEEAFKAIFAGEVSIGAVSYYPDFPTPFTFFGQFTCDQHDPFTHFCGADLDALVSQASQLQATDRTAANRKWAEVDRTVTDLSLWVPLVNEGSSFVSARLGNYQFSPGLGVLLDQAWVQ